MGRSADRRNIKKIDSAVNKRNKMRLMDQKIYDLIEQCHSTSKIEWKKVYTENDEFRDTQKKKMAESAQISLEDLLELVKL